MSLLKSQLFYCLFLLLEIQNSLNIVLIKNSLLGIIFQLPKFSRNEGILFTLLLTLRVLSDRPQNSNVHLPSTLAISLPTIPYLLIAFHFFTFAHTGPSSCSTLPFFSEIQSFSSYSSQCPSDQRFAPSLPLKVHRILSVFY